MAFIKKGQQEEVFIKNKDADLDTANVAIANITTLFVDTQEVSDLEVKGTLQVTGTPFTVDWTDVTAEQKTITLNDVPAPANPTDTNADQGGIILKGSTDKTILYDQITDSWTFTPEITTASLSDVDLTTNAPQPDEALIWDQTLNTGAGGWKPGNVDPTSIDFSIIQNLPTDLTGYGIIASIDDLSDVDTSTVAPTADQILIWNAQANSGTGGWEPADNVPGSIDWSTVTNTPTDLAGYGITDALTTSSTLDDLVGVDITTTPPTADQILKFDATLGANGEWVPADNVPPSVDWSTITNQPALSDLVGYNIVLTTGSTLNQLADISNVTPTADQILKYSPGSGWLIVDNVADEVDWANVTGTPTTLSGYNISDALNSATALINDLNDVDTTGLQANQVLKWDGSSNWIPTDATLSETVTSLTYNSSTHELTYTDESGTSTVVVDLSTYIDSIATITSGSFNSTTGIVTYTRTDNSTFTIDFSALLPGITYLSTLSDTNLTGANAPSDKEVLVWNQPSGSSGEWIAGKVDWSMVDNTPTNFTGYGIIANLDDLANVDTTGAALNKILIYNGTSWEVGDNVPGSIDWSTVTNTPTNLAGYGITDALSSSTTLSDLVGVSTTAPTQDQILVFDSTNGWEPKDNVADAVDWSSITNKPTTVATSGLTDALDDTTRIQDLSNVSSTTPTAGQILIYHAVNGWEPSNIPAPTAVAWTSITGKPTDVATSGLTDALSTSSTLNDLSGVNVQGATQGQVLQFDSTNGWEPVTPATFSETVTALSYDNVNNILSYTDESNVTNTINLSYLIDQNLPFINSGSFDPATKLFTLTRDDGSSFTVNLAGLASIVSLSGLTDTDIAGTPTDQYVLTWDSSLGTSGKWTAAAIPTPSSLQYINDISNVDAPTALLDQALLFNPSSGNWEASDIIWSKIKQTPTTVSAAGLTDALSTSSTLGDLSGVDLTTIVPTVGKALVYDGNNWIPDILTVSNITMDIGDLQDVNTTNPIQAAVQGSALVWTWNGSNFEWQPGTLQAYIGDLFDVDTTTAPQTNELLVWDSGSSKWKPGKVDWTMVDNTPTDLAGYGITDSVMISGVNVINDLADINSTAPSDGEVLTWDATASEWKPEVIASPTSVAWSAITGTPTDFSGYGIVASIDDLSDVDTSTNTPTNNQVLTWDSSLNSGSGGWKPADVPPATETLTTLVYDTLNNNLIYTDENSQVTTISLAQFVDTNLSRITSGTYNSSTNKIRFDRSADNTFVEVDLSALVSGAGASVLTDLTDVQIVNANLTGDELLSYDNSTSLWKAVAKSSVIPTSIGSFSDVDLTGITSGQVLKWVNNKFEAADDVGGSSYADSDVDTHLNTFSATSGQILSWNGTDYAWVADQIGSNYADSDVDSHLNVSGVTTGHVLSWNGTDYAWVAQSGGSGGGSSTLAGLTDTNTTNHPPVATNVLTWTANNTWEPQEIPAGFDGDYNSLTNKPTLYADSDVNTLLNQSSATSGQILSWNGTDYAWVADQTGSGSGYADSDVDTHLNVSGATTGQILSWNGTDYAWVADQTGSGYADSDVDTHLNVSGATTGQILSWNGTDYAWVADQTGSTIVPNSAIAETGVEVEIIVKVSSKTANHRYNGQGSGSGYIFTIDGIDYESPFLDLVPGKTYKFNQGDSSNSSHGIRFYEDAAKTTLYSTGVTISGNAGSSGAYTSIAVTTSTLSILHYQCVNHGYMGNQVQVKGVSGSSVSVIDDLSDVDTTNHPPVATNVLTWTANNTWEPQEAPSGGGSSSVVNITDLSDVDTTTNTPSQGTVLLYTANNLWEPATSRSFGTSHYRYDVPWANGGYDFSLSANDQSTISTGSTYDTWSTRTSSAHPHLESMAIGSYFLLTQHSGYPSYTPGGVGLYRKYADHTVSNSANNTRDYYFTFIGGSFRPTVLNNSTTIMSIHVLDSNIVKTPTESNNNFKFEIWDNKSGTPSYQTTIDSPILPASLGNLADVQLNWSGTSLTTTGPVANNVLQYSANGYWQAIEPVIDNLADVDTVSITPSDGDVLTWDGTINQWKPLASQLGSVASITELGDVDTTTIVPSINDVIVWTANNTFETQNAGTFWKYNVPWASGGYDFSLSANDQSTITTGSTYDTWSVRTGAAQPHLESMAIGSYFLLTQHSGYPSYTPGGVGLYRKYADHIVSNSANNTRDYYFTFISGSFRPTVLNNSLTIMSIHVLDSNIVTTESDNNFKFEIWDNRSGTPSYQGTIESPIIPASLGNLADVQLNWSGTSLTTTGPVANNVLQYSANGYWQAIEQVIDNLADVDTVSIAPSDGDVLTWDATTSQWKPLASALGSVASIDELGDVDTTTIVPSINDVIVWTANNTFETQDPGAFFRYDAPWPSTYNMGISANDQSTISTGSTYDTWTTRTSSVKSTLGSIKVGEYFLMTNHGGYPSYTPGGVSLFRCYQEYTVTNPANDTRAYYITHIDGDCRPTATNNGTQLFSVHKISNSRLYGNNNFKLEVFNNKSGTPSYQRTINVPKLAASLDDLMDVQIDFTGTSSTVTGPTTGDVLTWSANGFWQAMESAGGGSGSYADSDVDTHLNVSSATSGQVLSWNGTDYAWQTGSGGSSTLSGLTDTDTTTHAPQANDVLTWTANSTWEPQQSSSAITIGNLTDVDTTTNVPSNFDVLMWTTNNKWEPTEVVGVNNIETHKLDVSLGTSGHWSYLSNQAGAGVVTGTTHDTIIFNNTDNLSTSLFGNLEPGELFWLTYWGWYDQNAPVEEVGLYRVVSNVYVHTNNRVDIKHIAGWRLTSVGTNAVYLGTTKFDKSILSGSATYEVRNSDNSNAVIDEFVIPYDEAYPVHLGLLSNVDTETNAPLETNVLTWTANNTWEPQENPSITSSSIDGLTDVDTSTHPPNLADQLVWTANNTWEPQEIPPIEIHKLDVSFGTSGHWSYLSSNAGAGVVTGSTHDTIIFNNTDNLSSSLFGSRQIGELFWLTYWGWYDQNAPVESVGLYRMVSNVYVHTNNRIDIKHIAGWRLTSVGSSAVYLGTSDYNNDLKLSGYAEYEIRNSDNNNNVINTAVIPYDEAYPVHLGHLADVGDSALGSIVAGDVLTWTANNTWEPQQATGGSGGGSYADSDVDTHLNVSAATSGQILSWNGSDYAWVADQTGSGGGGGGSVTKTTHLTGDVSSTVATAGQILMWDGGTGKYVPTDGYLRSFSDVASTQPSDKEVLRWNVTNGEYESQLFPDFYTTIGNNQTPAVNSLLGWTANNAWEPVEPSAGINGDLDVLTDVTYNNRSNQSPSLDDVIQWTANNAWEPMTPPQGFDGDYNSLTNQPTIDDLYPTTRADYFGSINHDMIPSSNEVYDLGSSTKKWKDLFLSGTTINLGTVNLKSTASGGFQIQKAAAVGGGNPGDPAPLDTDVDWSNITNVPTTILGYGITDSADISTVDNVGDVDTTTVSATEGTVLTWTANNAWEPQLTQTASSNSRLKVIVCDGQSNTYQVNHKAGNVDIILNGIFMIPQITDWSDTTGTNNLSSGEYDYQSGTWDASTTTFTASSGAQADATHFKFSFIPDLNDKLMIRSY